MNFYEGLTLSIVGTVVILIIINIVNINSTLRKTKGSIYRLDITRISPRTITCLEDSINKLLKRIEKLENSPQNKAIKLNAQLQDIKKQLEEL